MNIAPLDQRGPVGAVLDFAMAREIMVDGQIRPNKVTDQRILSAMRTLPRELFVPPALAEQAYIDEDLVIAQGATGPRVLVEPLIVARLVQLLNPRAKQRALVVGAGTGYGAAVLAACGVHVTALEENEELLAIARQVLPRVGADVSVVAGPLNEGWAKAGPYDLILIEGAVAELPGFCTHQLRSDTGRLSTVIAPYGERSGNASYAVVGEPVPGGLRTHWAFDCATPLLPGLVVRPQFVF